MYCSIALKSTSATPSLIVDALTPCPSDLSAGSVVVEPGGDVDPLPDFELVVPDPHALAASVTRTAHAIAVIERVGTRIRLRVVFVMRCSPRAGDVVAAALALR